jgi:hypothetical protein
MIYEPDSIVNDIRNRIAEDATLEEYQVLIDSIDSMGVYERRGKAIVKKWEGECERRKAVEDKLPKVTAEVAGRLVFEEFKNSIDILTKR